MSDKVTIRPLENLEQAEKVRALFLEVYGDGYPVELYYQPETLFEVNRTGDTRSVVAENEAGDLVAHLAYFPSAPNRRLRELGAGLVSTRLRGQGVMGSMVASAVELARESGEVSMVFGEAVCNHTHSQKLLQKQGFLDTALELNLMPAEAYTTEKSATGRVASVLCFLPLELDSRELIVPSAYFERLETSIAWLGAPRKLGRDEILSPPEAERSELFFHRIAMACLTRIEVKTVGGDLLSAVEKVSAQDAVTQVYLPLDGRALSWAVKSLGQAGFVYGGYLPEWSQTDCLLLTRLRDRVNWSELQLFSQEGQRLAEWARLDH